MTRQEAIAAKCKDCNFDEADTGTWLAQVESCESRDCALYEYRPVTSKTKSARLSAKEAVMDAESMMKLEKKREQARAIQSH